MPASLVFRHPVVLVAPEVDRMQVVPPYVGLVHVVGNAVIKENPGRVLHDLLLSLMVHGKAPALVKLRLSLEEDLLNTRIVVIDRVIGPPRLFAKEIIEEVLRIRIVVDPYEEKHGGLALL